MRIFVNKIAGFRVTEAANNAKKAAANDASIGQCKI
jgi:hypothetical protein